LKGEISGNEDLVIVGTVEGRAHINEWKLTVGATAKLTADVIAAEVIVYGSVKGNVRGKGKIEIKKDGSVSGDMTTPQIIIEDGAYFKGSIEIEKSAEKESDKNALSRTAAASGAPSAGAGSRSI
jgi:cytoskeletal protein CcmA (bactofilin family)